MKYLLLVFGLLYAGGAAADTITARYPDYNYSKDRACSDAKLYIKNKASNECPEGIAGSVSTSCIQCTKKMRFNTPTWTCSGQAKFKCKGQSQSQADSNANSGFGDSTVRKMRGGLRQNTGGNKLGGPCLQFPNSERCRVWKRQYQKAVGGVRN